MDNLYKNMKMKLIEIDDTYGSLFGTITNTNNDTFKELFTKNGFSNNDLILKEKNMYSNILIIDNIFVDNDQRGKGIGNTLMDDLFDQIDANNIEALYLLADIHEEQEKGFNLIKWYEGYGFETLCNTPQGPIMKLEI